MLERKTPSVLVRFTAADGVQWTVWDCVFVRGKYSRRAHGDPEASRRIFVNAEGVRRSYSLGVNDSRVLDPKVLGRQLQRSQFLPTTKDDPSVYPLSEGEERTPTFHTVDVKRPARGTRGGGGHDRA